VSKGELNRKQQAFVDEYAVDRNGKQAAIRAGYSPRTAEGQASRLLSNAKVRAAVDAKLERLSRKTELTAEKVLRDLEQHRVLALAADNHNAANKASELQGKFLGIFVERQQVDVGPTLAQLLTDIDTGDGDG